VRLLKIQITPWLKPTSLLYFNPDLKVRAIKASNKHTITVIRPKGRKEKLQLIFDLKIIFGRKAVTQNCLSNWDVYFIRKQGSDWQKHLQEIKE